MGLAVVTGWAGSSWPHAPVCAHQDGGLLNTGGFFSFTGQQEKEQFKRHEDVLCETGILEECPAALHGSS